MPELQRFEIDSSRMPLRLGSALRVPSYAYHSWDIPIAVDYTKESDRQYEMEWKGGSPQQMQYIEDAAIRSGMGNYPQMLRDANAAVVSRMLRGMKMPVNYLETGAGVSTAVLYDTLERDGYDLEGIHATLVEPSKSRLMKKAVEPLREKGLKEGKHFTALNVRDVDVTKYIEKGSQHIISSVATMHHHSSLFEPLEALSRVMMDDGYVIIADWHNSMWEHPKRVYEFLRDDLEWETKDEDLASFAAAYPKFTEQASKLSGSEEEANLMIRRFWKAWADVRMEAIENGTFRPEDDILMLEAHRPVETYKGSMMFLTCNTDIPVMSANPWPLLPISDLLYVTVLQKTSE